MTDGFLVMGGGAARPSKEDGRINAGTLGPTFGDAGGAGRKELLAGAGFFSSVCGRRAEVKRSLKDFFFGDIEKDGTPE